jgi:hypothetical protein
MKEQEQDTRGKDLKKPRKPRTLPETLGFQTEQPIAVKTRLKKALTLAAFRRKRKVKNYLEFLQVRAGELQVQSLTLEVLTHQVEFERLQKEERLDKTVHKWKAKERERYVI